MQEDMDQRWVQRLENYNSALKLLEGLEKPEGESLAVYEEIAAAHCYEMVYELSWNLMRDFLAYAGNPVESNFARAAFKAAFLRGIISDNDLWVQMMLDRNKLSHIYNEEIRSSIIPRIFADYLSAFRSLQVYMNEQYDTAKNRAE